MEPNESPLYSKYLKPRTLLMSSNAGIPYNLGALEELAQALAERDARVAELERERGIDTYKAALEASGNEIARLRAQLAEAREALERITNVLNAETAQLHKWRRWWVNDGRAHASNPRFEADGDVLNEETRLLLARLSAQPEGETEKNG